MNPVFVECTYHDDCSFITRSYVSLVAISNLDDHLQKEHDTDFETEINRLESEEGQSVEELLREQVE